MWLVTGQAVNLGMYLRDILWVWDIPDWVTLHWVSNPEFDRKHDNLILREVVFRQFDGPVEERDGMLRFQLLRLSVGAVALETEIVDLHRAKQVVIVATMRLVTNRTRLFEYRLMQVRLLGLICLIGVAAQANVDGVRFG